MEGGRGEGKKEGRLVRIETDIKNSNNGDVDDKDDDEGLSGDHLMITYQEPRTLCA